MSEYRRVYLDRIKNGHVKQVPKPPTQDQDKSIKKPEQPPPYILDEGGVPRYQLPTEKTRQQTILHTEQT